MSRQPTILVAGMIAADPFQGGATWAVLQYVLGLQQLGCDVYLVEPLQPAHLPVGISLQESESAKYFQQVMNDFGLQDRAALLLAGTQETVGLSFPELQRGLTGAEVLLNISGMLVEPELTGSIPVRAYLDLDPAFIQLWHAQGIDMRFADHTHFITIGQAIGTTGNSVPTCGIDWIKTNQPIVLDRWPTATHDVPKVLTTVGNWRGYGSVELNGTFYGQKAHSLRRFFSLPKQSPLKFELAMAIHPKETEDLRQLHENGWQLVDPRSVAGMPAQYQRYIQNSWAEFGIAKSGYVASQCGWFSDRSVAYLASGRPVLAQDTGFKDFLPTGEGLLSFGNLAEALAGLEALQSDYARHATAARSLAETYFDSKRVLSRLLEELQVI